MCDLTETTLRAPPARSRPALAPSTPSAALAALAAALAATVAAVVLQRAWALDARFVWTAPALAWPAAGALVVLAARHGVGASFGRANVVTLARGALVMLLFGLVAAGRGAAVAWLAVALALVGLLLDGVDGKLARRGGETSAFGARFDMETDALQILALALLAWQLGRAGPWVLAAGLMRYAFVAAARVWPWMGRALPYSRRRQTVCVVQIVSLISCLVPLLPATAAAAIAAAGIAVLAWSFAIDVTWLVRRAGEPLHA